MIYTEMTIKAMNVAYDCHKGQKDKGGAPYITHPLHLAEQMLDEESTIVALLHDTVEDSDMTLEKLKKMGFSDSVLEAVALLTHKKEEPYTAYIRKIKGNTIAWSVKVADLKHNLDITRIGHKGLLTNKDRDRLVKYAEALEYLCGCE